MNAGYRVTPVLLLVSVLCSGVCAQDRPGVAGFASPEEVFAAYRKAKNERNWRAVFALGTARYQFAEIVDMTVLVLPLAASEEKALQAVFKKHGLDWAPLQELYESLVRLDENAENYLEISGRIFDRAANLIKSNVVDMAGLYADIYSYSHEKAPTATPTFYKLKSLVRKGSVASGYATHTVLETTRVIGPPGATPNETTRKVIVSSSILFRRIEGRWYLGLSDEGVAHYDRLMAED